MRLLRIRVCPVRSKECVRWVATANGPVIGVHPDRGRDQFVERIAAAFPPDTHTLGLFGGKMTKDELFISTAYFAVVSGLLASI
ncbi:unnamed protein product [Toxocara canis]|uniref:Ferredoxin n=1 Tax=Toxocara canis TaxID=6265 RepID=A0A183UV86_TOXCA|nr:unnamed protein product [Toxocara canis]